MKQDITLNDWQASDLRDPKSPASISLSLMIKDCQIVIEAADGRKIAIELEDGNLRALAYENENGKDAPVISIIPPHGEIVTRRDDYEEEDRPEPSDEITP